MIWAVRIAQILFIAIYFISIAFLLAKIFKTGIDKMLFPGLITSIIILYISCVFTNLIVGVFLLTVLMLIGILWYIIDIFKYKINVLNINILLFILLVLYFGIIYFDKYFGDWDDFSHWGLAIKNMYYINDFTNLENATTGFKNYPPALTLLATFLMKLARTGYNEGTAFLSSDIIIISVIISTLSYINYNNIYQRVFSIILLIISTEIFLHSFLSIQADTTLFIILAYLSILYFVEKNNCIKIFCIILSAFILPLIKASGLGLAIIVGFTILLIKDYKYSIIVFISSILSNFSWKLYLKMSGTKSYAFANANLDFIKNGLLPWQKLAITNFIDNISKNPYVSNVFNITIINLLLILIILTIIFTEKCSIKNLPKFYIYNIIFTFIYSGYLLFLYLTKFGEYEGAKNASFYRYMATYISYLIFVFIFFVLYHITDVKKIFIALFVVLLVFDVSNHIFGLTPYNLFYKGNSYVSKVSVSKCVENVKMSINKNDNISILFADQGSFIGKFNYEYYPYKPVTGFDIVNRYNGINRETVLYTKKEIYDLLIKQDAKYVYIHGIPDDYIDKYKMYFYKNNMMNENIYRIVDNYSENNPIFYPLNGI